MLTQQETDRFLRKIEKQKNGCWLWKDPLDKDGYGSFFLRRKNRRAHRVGYLIGRGAIPDGMVINHKCGNRSCVNHQHLEAVTKRENALKDSVSVCAINARKTHCPKGHPYDKVYGKQRACSTCDKEKQKRLRKKWSLTDSLKGVV